MTPAIRPNWRSSGVATAEAIVSGLAPGRPAETLMVGNSTSGQRRHGQHLVGDAAGQRQPGREERGADRPLDEGCREAHRSAGGAGSQRRRRLPWRMADVGRLDVRRRRARPIEEQVDHRRGVERQHLADDQAAHDRDAERMPQLRPGAGAQRQRDAAEQRRHGGHHDRPEAQQAGLVDGLFGRLAFLALRLQREIDHHDGVLLHDADQQNDADQRDHVEIVVRDQQRQNRAHTRRRQRGENRERMDVAFVEHAQHDIDRHQRGQNQQRLIRQGVLERLRGALKTGLDAGRKADLLLGLVNHFHRVAQRDAGRQVEGESHHRKLSLVADDQRRVARLEVRDLAERHLRVGWRT